MIERFSKDTIIICTKISTELKDLSDEAWLSGAVYSDRYSYAILGTSDNAKIYTDGITIGKEYKVTEKTILSIRPFHQQVGMEKQQTKRNRNINETLKKNSTKHSLHT